MIQFKRPFTVEMKSNDYKLDVGGAQGDHSDKAIPCPL